MYLFKNSLNNWIFGGTPASICPAGAYRIEPNSDRSAVSIISISGDMIVHRLIPVTKFLDATGTPYTDWAAFIAATAGFFDAPTSTDSNSASILTSVQVMDDWDEFDRAKVNLIVGQAGVSANSGNKDATTQRVVVATDDVNVAAIKTAVVNSPVPVTGTVALGTSRLIPSASGVQMNRHKITVQLLSANLSGNTTFAPEASADGTNWDVLTQNETDISHTLVDDAPFFRTYEVDKGAYIRWNMAGVTTGDVAYVINN